MELGEWQSNKRLADTNLYMLEHEIDVDVTFLVGEGKEEVKGHRFMLVSRSPVFYAMLLGPLAEKSNTVTVPDIDKNTFLQFLRFLYTEEISLEAETVMTVMYAAKKYDVQALIDKCSLFLKENMSTENVCTILNQAHMFDEDQLKKDCLNFIFENGTCVLQSESFLSLTPQCLQTIVKSDSLYVEHEADVYHFCVDWSKEECRRQGLEVTEENCRSMLGDILYLVRYHEMSKEYIARTVSSDNILNENEKQCILQYFSQRTMDATCELEEPFTSRRRDKSNRFDMAIDRFTRVGYPWNHDTEFPDAISFSCSANTTLVGFRLYIPDSDKGVLSGTISVIRNYQVLAEQHVVLKGTASQNERTHTVYLHSPITVEKNMPYDIVQSYQGSTSYFGEGGKSAYECNDLTVSFDDSFYKKNSTTISRGQIPTFLFK